MWESRVAPVSGVLFAVFLLGSFLMDPNTDFMPPPDEVVAYLADGPLVVMTAAYVRLLAAAALIWFAGSLYKSLKEIEDDDGRLSLLAFGGALVGASMLALASVAIVAAAERVWITESIEPGAAASLFDVASIAVGNAAPIGLGVMIGAAGIAKLRTSEVSRWAGWTSVVIALGLISPYAWIVIATALVWVPLVGVSIYRNQANERELASVS